MIASVRLNIPATGGSGVCTGVGAGPFTVIVTGLEVMLLPPSSVAFARTTWLPDVAVQMALYGSAVAVPTVTPSTVNTTLATPPSLSDAVAESVTACPTVKTWPFAGPVSDTVGGRLISPGPHG